MYIPNPTPANLVTALVPNFSDIQIVEDGEYVQLTSVRGTVRIWINDAGHPVQASAEFNGGRFAYFDSKQILSETDRVRVEIEELLVVGNHGEHRRK